jgi:hypothetical protein
MTQDSDDPFAFESYLDRSPWDRLPLLEEQRKDLRNAWLAMRGDEGFNDRYKPKGKMLQRTPDKPDGLRSLEWLITRTRREIEFVQRSAERPEFAFRRPWRH